MRYVIIFITTLAVLYLVAWLQKCLDRWQRRPKPTKPQEQPMEQHCRMKFNRTGRPCEYCGKIH